MTEFEPIDRKQLLENIRELLPAPIREKSRRDGTLILFGGDPGEVAVRVRANAVTLAVFAVAWKGPCTPVERPQNLANLSPKILPATKLLKHLHDLIESARTIRLSRYRTCVRCGETNPPEWLHGNTCLSFAEKYDGIVH